MPFGGSKGSGVGRELEVKFDFCDVCKSQKTRFFFVGVFVAAKFQNHRMFRQIHAL